MGDSKMKGIKMEAEIIFESYATIAFRRALEYAGDDGFVASMPQLLHARVNAPYDNMIWNTWFTSNSEESVATTSQGHRVVVAVHGGGIFGSPSRGYAKKAKMIPQWVEGCFKALGRQIAMDGLEVKKLW